MSPANDESLARFLEGDLDEDERRSVARDLARNPALARRAQELEAIAPEGHFDLAPVDVPDGLEARVLSTLSKEGLILEGGPRNELLDATMERLGRHGLVRPRRRVSGILRAAAAIIIATGGGAVIGYHSRWPGRTGRGGDRIVYVDRPVDRIVTVEKPVDRIVTVEKPVERKVYIDRPVDRVVEKPVDRVVTIEKIIERERPAPEVLRASGVERWEPRSARFLVVHAGEKIPPGTLLRGVDVGAEIVLRAGSEHLESGLYAVPADGPLVPLPDPSAPIASSASPPRDRDRPDLPIEERVPLLIRRFATGSSEDRARAQIELASLYRKIGDPGPNVFAKVASFATQQRNEPSVPRSTDEWETWWRRARP